MPATDTELTFQIKGLDCAGCAQTLEKGIGQLDHVTTCQLNFNTEKLRVWGDVSPEVIINRVRELGFEAIDLQAPAYLQSPVSPAPGFWQFMWQRRDTRLALLGALLIIPAVLLSEFLAMEHPLLDLASIGALFVAGWPIAGSAWQAVRINREININVLMTLAGLGALLIGEYTEAGTVMVLFALGEALEGYTTSRSRASIRALMQIVPNEATRLDRRNQQPREIRVKVDSLQLGDVIVVKPGEYIPMDGRVTAGASSVNQAPITGESQLIEKGPGSRVFASSINGEGTLEIEVTRLAADNTISRMIKLVEEAQEKRAPAQRFVDRFARYYTPAVVVLAALVAVIPPLFFGQPFLNPNPQTFGWLYRGLALLVVACPCALVISTPVSIISAISNAARHGILIKGGLYLEQLNKIAAIALDKTGTITAGKPAVVAVRSASCALAATATGDRQSPAGTLATSRCQDCDDLLALASAVERRSEHPIAHAIATEATRLGLHQKYPAAEMVTALTGRGVTGQVAGRRVTIGSHRYFDANIPHSQAHCAQANNDAARGYTPMMVSADGQYMGIVTVADTVRQSSREAVMMLQQLGLKAIVMLTGDNPTTARQVGQQVGVTDIRAELLPENKVAAVEALQREFGPVAMVGDGINDAPALATANIGIAIGAASGGTAQAMETADITLMSDDLRNLPFAFKLSRAAMQTIHVNVALSLGIKMAFLILVLLGLGTMWMAVLADMGTSLLVTLNGTRLLRRP